MKIDFNPDSFSGQLILSLVDKIFFGFIAALAIAVFQSFWSANEQANNRRTVILNSYSDSIIEQRKSLLVYLRGYLSLVKKYESTEKIKSDKDIKTFNDLANNIELTIITSSIMNEAVLSNNKIDEFSEPFIKSIYGLIGDMTSGIKPDISVVDQQKTIVKQYKDLLKAMNDSAIKASAPNCIIFCSVN